MGRVVGTWYVRLLAGIPRRSRVARRRRAAGRRRPKVSNGAAACYLAGSWLAGAPCERGVRTGRRLGLLRRPRLRQVDDRVCVTADWLEPDRGRFTRDVHW